MKYEQSNPSPQVRACYFFLFRLHVPRPFLDINTTTDHTRWPYLRDKGRASWLCVLCMRAAGQYLTSQRSLVQVFLRCGKKLGRALKDPHINKFIGLSLFSCIAESQLNHN